MTKARFLVGSALAALATFGLPWTPAEANHVKFQGPPEPVSPAPAVVVPVPGPPVVTSYAPAPVQQTLQADEIKANQIRAQIIYANKIEADDIQGTVHQTGDVKVGHTRGDIKTPYVSASVIYADEIKANSIVADHIYVRDLERH